MKILTINQKYSINRGNTIFDFLRYKYNNKPNLCEVCFNLIKLAFAYNMIYSNNKYFYYGASKKVYYICG